MKLLFVCTGNICRSPMAEGIAREALKRSYPEYRQSVEVASAGTSGLDGEPPTVEAVGAMERLGIDIREHRAQSVSRGLTESSDLVLVMEERQGAHVSALSRGVTVPVFPLLKLAEAAGVVLKAEEKGLKPVGPTESIESLASVAVVMERNDAWELPSHRYEVGDPIGMPLEWYVRAAGIMESAIGDVFRVIFAGDP